MLLFVTACCRCVLLVIALGSCLPFVCVVIAFDCVVSLVVAVLFVMVVCWLFICWYALLALFSCLLLPVIVRVTVLC